MVTEEDFQSALDLNWGDWQTRLVFADWLEERGDVRADGYRALGVLNLRPYKPSSVKQCPYWVRKSIREGSNAWVWELCRDWFDALDVNGKGKRAAPDWSLNRTATRRQLEDAAALAFGKLTDARRLELLQTAGSAS